MMDFKKLRKSLKKAQKALEQIEMMDTSIRKQLQSNSEPRLIGDNLTHQHKKTSSSHEMLTVKSLTYEEWLKRLTYRQQNESDHSGFSESEIELIRNERISQLGEVLFDTIDHLNEPFKTLKKELQQIETKNIELLKLLTSYEQLRNDLLTGSTSDVAKLLSQIDAQSKKNKNKINEQQTALIKNSIDDLNGVTTLLLSLKQFTTKDETHQQQINLNDALDHAAIVAEHLFANQIRIAKEYGSLPEILVYPTLMKQVFLNLISYAGNSLGNHSGEILIRTSAKEDGVKIYISSQESQTSTDSKSIKTGKETESNMIEHRKPNLALSYKIIEKHHGKLSLANKIGLGSEVMISIPIVSVVLGIATPSSNASTHLN